MSTRPDGTNPQSAHPSGTNPQSAHPSGTNPQSARPGGANPQSARPGGANPDWAAKLRRIRALVRKESYQLVRDPSSIAIGIAMPVILVLLFGYGLSLDVRNVPVAIALEDSSPEARALAAGFELSPYFEVRWVRSMRSAEQLLLEGAVRGVVRIPFDFARRVERGDAQVQLVVHGTDANTARIVQGYAQGAVAQWTLRRAAEGRLATAPAIGLQTRLWYNEASDSRHFLVPGLIVLVMTLIGAFLTALVVAREWERGTFEALFVTPVRADEILLGKTVPYFLMGLLALALCVLGAVLLFGVPLRGSLWILSGVSTLYLLVALGLGLLISSLTKNQLVASQLALLLSFLPALMLSGFLFDLRSMPAPIRLIASFLPARYYVELLQTLFLAGDVWAVIVPNTAVLAAMAAALLLASRAATRKRLE